jgi:hypothetical protein
MKLLICGLFAFSLTTYAAELEFKGHKLNMATDKEVCQKSKMFKNDGKEGCIIETTFATVKVKVVYMFIDKKLLAANGLFNKPNDNFEIISKALIAKYGKPTKSETLSLTNAFGAKVAGYIHNWEMPDGVVIVKKYNNNFTEGAVQFISKKLLPVFDKDKKDSAEKALKDM